MAQTCHCCCTFQSFVRPYSTFKGLEIRRQKEQIYKEKLNFNTYNIRGNSSKKHKKFKGDIYRKENDLEEMF